MVIRAFKQAALLLIAGATLVSVGPGLAASNAVQSTHLSRQRIGLNANSMKPAECAALNLTSVVLCPAGGGNCDGTDASDLIIGSPNADSISGGKGDDCILGGRGDDFLKAEQGNDICIGGAGSDTFHPSCEMQIQ